jgi:rsbT antagonist protein RsbS
MQSTEIAVIKIYNILLVTVPPDPDDDTISQLQEKVLESMEKYAAEALILDISTVVTLDSFFARTIVETAQMFKLMGGQTIIAGMMPNVAITATQLGLTLGDIQTSLNVDRALDMLNKRKGQ